MAAPPRTTPSLADTAPALMEPGEVARILRMDPKTIARWAKQGRLRHIRTLGGHRRYFESDIRAILDAQTGGGGAA